MDKVLYSPSKLFLIINYLRLIKRAVNYCYKQKYYFQAVFREISELDAAYFAILNLE